jgi:voltage-gated potassium channel
MSNFQKLREELYIIVFGTDTKAGRLFDVVLLWFILGSIMVVMVESVKEIRDQYDDVLNVFEWVFTVFFTIEYVLRISISKKPLAYAKSFFGIIDLVAVLPTYIALIFSGGSYLIVIRAIRLLRVFRILKLTRQINEAQVLIKALKASRHKIFVFLGAVVTLVVIMGTLMYMIEGGANGFTSIPRSIYWAIVTITTVGYGDIAPHTMIGQAFAAVLMLLGYAIIAVPTGIVTAEITAEEKKQNELKESDEFKTCLECQTYDHELDAAFCKNCGSKF